MSEDGIDRTPALPWWPQLPWHAEPLRAVTGLGGAMPHALLVHGLPGIGKHVFALHLAQALLCEARLPTGEACGACLGCRYVVVGQHPDLMRLELATLNDETGELEMVEGIAIERIRALIAFVQLTSHRGGAKVAVIAPAERMNLAAANALLKTLEEPPPGTHLILVSHQPGRLPATVVSRCRRFPLRPPSLGSARGWLHAQGVAAPDPVLAQAGGAPLAALALAEPAIQQERRLWLAALAAPGTLSVVHAASRVESGGRDERKRRLALYVDWLIGWTEDLARAVVGAPPLKNPDFGPALAALGPRVARLALFRYHRVLLEQRALLAHPLQPRLVAEALLVDYRELFEASGSA
ncbi:MAG: DNA polymerase III subunit delta' [Casimicrobiaceae bacterium]